MDNEEPTKFDQLVALTEPPSQRWKWLAAGSALLGAIALVIAFITLLVTVIGSNSREGKKDTQIVQLNTRISQLNGLLQIQTDTTACIRLLGIHRDELRDIKDTTLDQAIVTSLQRGDVLAVIQPFADQVKAWQDASTAYNNYIEHPSLPCPIKEGN